jgi:hypothetical protein
MSSKQILLHINRQGAESRNILFAGLDQPIKSCEKIYMFLKLFWMKGKVKEQIFGQYIK